MNLIERRELKLLIKEIIKEELSKGSNVNEAYKGERWYKTGEKPKRTLMDKLKDYLGVAAVGMGLGLLPGVAPDENEPQRHQASSAASSQTINKRQPDIKSRLFSNTGIEKEEDLRDLDTPNFIAAIQLMIENIPSRLSQTDKDNVDRLIRGFISSRRGLQRVQINRLQRQLKSKLR